MATNAQLAKTQQDQLDILARASLKMAGFKRSDLRLAYRRTVEALTAVKIQVSYNRQTGEEVDRIEHVDHMTRIMAARQLMSMVPDMFPVAHGGPITSGNGIVVEVALCTPDGTRTVVRVGAQSNTVVASNEQVNTQ